MRVPSSNPAAGSLIPFAQKLIFTHQCVQLSFEPLDHTGLASDGSFKFRTTFSDVTLFINCREDFDPEVEGFRLRFLASAGGEVIFVVRCAQGGNKVTIV